MTRTPPPSHHPTRGDDARLRLLAERAVARARHVAEHAVERAAAAAREVGVPLRLVARDTERGGGEPLALVHEHVRALRVRVVRDHVARRLDELARAAAGRRRAVRGRCRDGRRGRRDGRRGRRDLGRVRRPTQAARDDLEECGALSRCVATKARSPSFLFSYVERLLRGCYR